MSHYAKVDTEDSDQPVTSTDHYIPTQYPPQYAVDVVMSTGDYDDGLSAGGAPPGYARSLSELYSNTFTLVRGRTLFWIKVSLPGLSAFLVTEIILMVVLVASVFAAAVHLDLDLSGRDFAAAAESISPMGAAVTSFASKSIMARDMEEGDWEEIRQAMQDWGFAATYMIIFTAALVTSLAMLLAINLIRTPLIYAMQAFHIKTAPEINFTTTFKASMPRYWVTLGTTILANLIVFGGYLLFIIPGIILSIMYALAYVVPILEPRGVMDSLRTARQLTDGQFWRTVVFLGSLKLTMMFITFCIRYLVSLIGVPTVQVLMMCIVSLFEELFMVAGLVIYYNDLCGRRTAPIRAIQL